MSKIILYRNEVKGFKKKEDIMNVKGIGKKKFDNIKNYIKTE
ncbi:MAG: helix-hairpin-helix domain-containing protein [Ignavibacteria bacterium]|nr:helix-hairpin-helix domain-containing protein [Ignavibacteria bacterium]